MCETHHPLQNFTDWYDDKWITYLLEKLNTPQGHDTVNPGATLTHDLLSDELKDRNRNRTTLSNFAAPEDIPPEDVWNNCWYDKRHKMYYVADDNMTENLSNHANSDPDHSQTMMGRRVWGFAEVQVDMFCGFPSIKHDTGYDSDEYYDITTVRSTGEILRVSPNVQDKKLYSTNPQRRGHYREDGSKIWQFDLQDSRNESSSKIQRNIFCRFTKTLGILCKEIFFCRHSTK